jgi:hypothetical protein
VPGSSLQRQHQRPSSIKKPAKTASNTCYPQGKMPASSSFVALVDQTMSKLQTRVQASPMIVQNLLPVMASKFHNKHCCCS